MTAELFVLASRARLLGQSVPTVDAKAQELIWYGYPSIKVVWALLKGADSLQMPQYYSVDRGKVTDPPWLQTWASEQAAELLATLRAKRWRWRAPFIGC